MYSTQQRTRSYDERTRNLESNRLQNDSSSGYPLWIFLIPAGFFIASIFLTGFVLMIIRPHTDTWEDQLDETSKTIVKSLELFAATVNTNRHSYISLWDNNKTTSDGLDLKNELVIGVVTSYIFFDTRVTAVLNTWATHARADGLQVEFLAEEENDTFPITVIHVHSDTVNDLINQDIPSKNQGWMLAIGRSYSTWEFWYDTYASDINEPNCYLDESFSWKCPPLMTKGNNLSKKWFMKVDDDTYVNHETLLGHLEKLSNIEEPIYAGGCTNYSWWIENELRQTKPRFQAGTYAVGVPEIFCGGGSGYILNIHALRLMFDFKFSKKPSKAVPYGDSSPLLQGRFNSWWCQPWRKNEDLSMGRCMMYHGVWPWPLPGFYSEPPVKNFRGHYRIDPNFVTYHHLEAEYMTKLHEEGNSQKEGPDFEVGIELCNAVEKKTNRTQKDFLRGVAPSKNLLYCSEKFRCLSDPSTEIPLDRVNDNYCDCQDGSDEPGTSACSSTQQKFYCNIYDDKFIHTSFVNDGVCDCCDGSDEYKLAVCTFCASTCGMVTFGNFKFYPLNAAMFTFSFVGVSLVMWYFGWHTRLAQMSLSLKKSPRHRL